jgi:hypothetical protein
MSALGLGCVKTPELNLRTEFRLDFNQFEKQKGWRRLSGQDNRENNSARFSCAHVFTQPGSKASLWGRPVSAR